VRVCVCSESWRRAHYPTFDFRRPIASRPWVGSARANTAYASTTNGAFAFAGQGRALWRLRLSITT